jgi:arginine deiminase
VTVRRNHDLWQAVAGALGLDKVTVQATDEDVRAAEREQCDDRVNYLAVAPGVIIGYQRNIATSTTLRKHGIEVITHHRRQRAGPRHGRADLRPGAAAAHGCGAGDRGQAGGWLRARVAVTAEVPAAVAGVEAVMVATAGDDR